MKKSESRILATVGVVCALTAFFFMLFAPAVAIKYGHFDYPAEWGEINGLEIIFGSAAKGSVINFILQYEEYIAVMTISGLEFSFVNFIPHFLIIIGIVVFGILAALDDKKLGIICSIVTSICFLVSAIILILMFRFAVPSYEVKEITQNIPSGIMKELESEGIQAFRDSFTFGSGAIIGFIFMFLAFVSTATGVILNLIDHKQAIISALAQFKEFIKTHARQIVGCITIILGLVSVLLIFAPALILNEKYAETLGGSKISGATVAFGSSSSGLVVSAYMIAYILPAIGIILSAVALFGKGGKIVPGIAALCFFVGGIFHFLPLALATPDLNDIEGEAKLEFLRLFRKVLRETSQVGAGGVVGGILSILAAAVSCATMSIKNAD